IDNLENRSRRNNKEILGFPEGVENGNLTNFLSKVLPELLGLDPDCQLEIKRAHRSLGPCLIADQHPRAFIIKFLRYPMRDQLLRATHNKGPLTWNSSKISLYPDLSRDLQQKRQCFTEVRKQLQTRGFTGCFYPAILKITYNGETTTYNNLEDAMQFLNSQLSQLHAKKL
uniref:L1 transposable element RRM domain-containing protein n=1 Tax=Latimeria chalumnae TaxID=7897 RepID=H3AV63_LATCH